MNEATYSPEDNKLRLYVGRVPRDEYLKLRAEGWTATPKQDCNFVATWTPSRRDTALKYADIITDEDQGPEDRAADRAERFGEYRDKRTQEATGQADRFDQGPQAHGYQSQARAERAAGRHDRLASHAVDAWSKAEYWQRRTAGVISHALYKSRPDVRMGRIKTIEAELRRMQASLSAYADRFNNWLSVAKLNDPTHKRKAVNHFSQCEHGDYLHPKTGKSVSLYIIAEDESVTPDETATLWLSKHPEPVTGNDWTQHLILRLAYENQMLEAQGGRAAMIEMEPGGFIGGFQIRKVNKSNATGRVVSVNVLDPQGWSGFTRESGYKEHVTRAAVVMLNIERLDVSAYRAPTDEDKAKLAATLAAEKAAAPDKAPCPLINPTDADAERLQNILNERAKADHCARFLKAYGRDYAEEFKLSTVCRVTQANYSVCSKGGYARAETRNLHADTELGDRESNLYTREGAERVKRIGPAVCQIRTTGSNGSDYGARRVIVLTDKPQKPLPAAVWEKYTAPTTTPDPKAGKVLHGKAEGLSYTVNG